MSTWWWSTRSTCCPYLDFDLDLFLANLRAVNPAASVISVSARTGDGVDAWCDWLRDRLADVAGG